MDPIFKRSAIALAIAATVSACGGGGGSDIAVSPQSTHLAALSATGNSNDAATLSAAAGSDAGADDANQAASEHEDKDHDDVVSTLLPTGQRMTPTAARGAVYLPLKPGLKDNPDLPAGFAQSEVLSPDGKTLLVLTSGYNYVVDAKGGFLPKDSTQFVFVYDVSGGTPIQKQVLQVSNSYIGIAFSPDGKAFYVPGAGEDNVHVFSLANGVWAENGSPIPLGHTKTNGLAQDPTASGIAVTADGKRAVVVNRYNDSVTIVDLVNRKVLAEQDLRPGKSGGVGGTPGGEYPNSVAIVGNRTAFVSSERDREIVVVDISGSVPSVSARIAVPGNPNKMVLDRSEGTLFVASDNADVVSIIDTQTRVLKHTVSTIAPRGVLTPAQARYKGASPDGLALSPDGKTLYVTNRGSNSLAVITLDARLGPRVTGLIPTGWYPSDVRVSNDGQMLYVSNAKTLPGPNPGNCLGYETVPCPVKDSPVTFAPNQYIENLTGSALLAFPKPQGGELHRLTRRVAKNNHFHHVPSDEDARVLATLRENIKHVIYIVKENRTYDQVLGDLGKGNGDARLTEFPRKTTPNLHALADQFVALDNFYDTGEVSGNGWPWSTAARESDAGAKMLPPNYAGNGGGGSYDWEGTNRNVNVGLSGTARNAANPLSQSLDADTLPGTGNVAAPDGPDGEVQQGYLWNSALRAGLSVRNYGFFIDLSRYFVEKSFPTLFIKRDRTPFANKSVQAYSANPDLAPLTDPYFRGFDDSYPDFYREQEWEREFAGYVANKNLPNLSLVRLMNDHTGSFGAAIDGVNTPEVQVADNDYAVGRLIETVAKSPYANSTLIFIVEDDAQDGPDHVDAHRSTAFVVGPYVKKAAVVGKHYTTVNVLRTITDVLGIDHLGAYDANEGPMTEVFDLSQTSWSFTATASSLLKSTSLPLPKTVAYGAPAKTTHSATYWAARTRTFDFSKEDKVDALAYNKVLWQGLMGDKPYPTTRRDLDDAADRQKMPTQSRGATAVPVISLKAG